MKLQTKVDIGNSWSCTLLAFAMAFDVQHKYLTMFIGHDGSSLADPFLTEPAGRQGFHIQELVMYGLCAGKSMTPFQIAPQSEYKSPDRPPTVLNLGCGQRVDFAEQLIQNHRGVIIVETSGTNHAVAFENGTIYDPAGRIFPCDDLIDLIENHRYYPIEVWVVK